MNPDKPPSSARLKNDWLEQYASNKYNQGDMQFTDNAVTQIGMQELYTMTRVTGDDPASYTTEFHDALAEAFNLPFQTDLTSNLAYCFPLFRMLMETFGEQNYPTLYQFAQHTGGCRISQHCRNTLVGGGRNLTSNGPAGTGSGSFSKLIPAKIGVFCTKVKVKVEYFGTENFSPTALPPLFTEEVVYETLGRDSKNGRLISRSYLHETTRNRTQIQPDIFETVFEPGWEMERNPQRGCALITEFLKNKYFLNVDPSLIIGGLESTDRLGVSLEWQGIEGKPEYLICLFMAAYLKSSLELQYKNEVNSLLSKAINDKNQTARRIITIHFPDAQKDVDDADKKSRDAFGGVVSQNREQSTGGSNRPSPFHANIRSTAKQLQRGTQFVDSAIENIRDTIDKVAVNLKGQGFSASVISASENIPDIMKE